MNQNVDRIGKVDDRIAVDAEESEICRVLESTRGTTTGELRVAP